MQLTGLIIIKKNISYVTGIDDTSSAREGALNSEFIQGYYLYMQMYIQVSFNVNLESLFKKHLNSVEASKQKKSIFFFQKKKTVHNTVLSAASICFIRTSF